MSKLVNGNGVPIQLRGCNFPMDSQNMSGTFWNGNPGGAYFGSDGAPIPTIVKSWKMNCARITTNAGNFLNLNMGVLGGTVGAPTWGANVSGDPLNVYRDMIRRLIIFFRSGGMYPILELHWTSAQFTFGGTTKFGPATNQPPFIDYDMGLPFWTAGVGAGPVNSLGAASTGLVAQLALWFGTAAFNTANGFNGGAAGTYNNPAIGGTSGFNDCIFEIFNEPYVFGGMTNVVFNTANGGGGSSLTYQQFMKSGGWCSKWKLQDDTSTYRGGLGIPYADADGNFPYWWRSPGYQAVVNGIRALGATNVILINTALFAHQLCDLPSIMPTDTLSPSQLATGYHDYEYNGGNSGWPTAANGGCDSGTNGTSSANALPVKVMTGTAGLGAAIPVVITEAGNSASGTSGTNSGYMDNMHAALDGQAVGTNGWLCWAWLQQTNVGGTGAWQYQEVCMSATMNFSASCTSGGVLTLTSAVTGGPTFGEGSVLTGGGAITNGSVSPCWDRPWVSKLLSGTAGASGSTYQMSSAPPSSWSSQAMTAYNVLPMPQQGTKDQAWMAAHAA